MFCDNEFFRSRNLLSKRTPGERNKAIAILAVELVVLLPFGPFV